MLPQLINDSRELRSTRGKPVEVMAIEPGRSSYGPWILVPPRRSSHRNQQEQVSAENNGTGNRRETGGRHSQEVKIANTTTAREELFVDPLTDRLETEDNNDVVINDALIEYDFQQELERANLQRSNQTEANRNIDGNRTMQIEPQPLLGNAFQ